MVGEGANFLDVVSLFPPQQNFFGLNRYDGPVQGCMLCRLYAEFGPDLLAYLGTKAKDWEMQYAVQPRQGEDAIGSMQTDILSPNPSKSAYFKT